MTPNRKCCDCLHQLSNLEESDEETILQEEAGAGLQGCQGRGVMTRATLLHPSGNDPTLSRITKIQHLPVPLLDMPQENKPIIISFRVTEAGTKDSGKKPLLA